MKRNLVVVGIFLIIFTAIYLSLKDSVENFTVKIQTNVPQYQIADFKTEDSNKTAYAFYATNNKYYCYVLILANKLMSYSPNSRHDYILIYSQTGGINPKLFENLSPKAKTIPVSPIRGISGKWVESFTRFYAWNLTDYSKVVVLDSDQWVMQSLDHLFDVPLPSDGSNIAAPLAYWLQKEKPNFFTSICTVIRPSTQMFIKLQQLSLARNHSNGFDMDILNIMFPHYINLGTKYAALDGEWMPKEEIYHMLSKRNVTPAVMHFSKSGKPEHCDAIHKSKFKNRRGPFVTDIYRQWCIEKKKVCLKTRN